MKVLLDENLAHRLRMNLGVHEVFTGDPNAHHEQALTGRTIAIVALSSVEWDILKHHLPSTIAALDSAQPGTFQAVNCGAFVRKK